MAAVIKRFGSISWDLAADRHNTKALNYITKHEDSLSVDWSKLRGNLWLNPEFGNIRPFAKKCAETPVSPYRRIIMLTPLTSAKWAASYCHGKGQVLALLGRIKFVGHKIGFPKDLMLTVYDQGVPGFKVWDWRSQG
jgi:hypothetical protein